MKHKSSDSGKYILFKPLETGGMSSIYLAHHITDPDKMYVIKKIIEKSSASTFYIEMFHREAEISKKLDHPNIVKTFEVGQNNHDLFIVLEYIPGFNLREIISAFKDQAQDLKLEVILYLLKEISKGLVYLHHDKAKVSDCGPIIHRDISPQNIMIDKDGAVKIIDFGISKNQTDLSYTPGRTLKGKFSYMSPEQSRGENLTVASDVFSLGLLAVELITGKKMFEGQNEMLILNTLNFWTKKSMEDILDAVPEKLKGFIAQMLQPLESDRISSLELLYQLETALRRVNASYDLKDFKSDLSVVFNEYRENTTTGISQVNNIEQDSVLSLYSVLIEPIEGDNESTIINKWLLPLTVVLGIVLFLAIKSMNTKKAELLAERKPAQEESIISPIIKLKFSHLLDENLVLEVNGVKLSKANKVQGIDVPAGKEVMMKVYNKKQKKWYVKKFIPEKRTISSIVLNM